MHLLWKFENTFALIVCSIPDVAPQPIAIGKPIAWTHGTPMRSSPLYRLICQSHMLAYCDRGCVSTSTRYIIHFKQCIFEFKIINAELSVEKIKIVHVYVSNALKCGNEEENENSHWKITHPSNNFASINALSVISCEWIIFKWWSLHNVCMRSWDTHENLSTHTVNVIVTKFCFDSDKQFMWISHTSIYAFTHTKHNMLR